AETMLQYYKHPVLLVEFDQNKSFTLDAVAGDVTASGASASRASGGGGFIPGQGSAIQPNNPRSTQHLLTLLVLTFPRLKIIWSSSPYQTAEIFAEMKRSLPEPDPIRAVQMGLDFDVAAAAGAAASTQAGSGADGTQGGSTNNERLVSAASGIEHRLFHQLPQDMMRAVPGMTEPALERICLETECIQDVANMTTQELEPVVGKEVARQVVGFFEKSVF
ncbi:hypothetical protein KEM52_005238, partial [Ascosphaera acerosa]